jgi:Tol biopolymer transport system component
VGVLPAGVPITAIQVPSAPVSPTVAKTHLLRDGVTQAVTGLPQGNGARFYNPEDGRFYRVEDDGTITMLSSKQFFNVDNVSWGKQQDQAILEFPDGSNVYYDFDAKKQVTLPKHWENFDFAPDDNKVAAKSIGLDEDNRWLMISNPDGTEAKAIEPLGNNAGYVHAAWTPQGDVIAYTETGELRGNSEQQILFIGKNHENFRGLIAPGQGFVPNWSPTGKQLLFSVWNPSTNNKPALWLSAGETANIGRDRHSLSIQTWADKCAWASDTELYCGVPQSLPDNAGIRRENFATLPDDVFRIDLNTGVASKITSPEQNHPIRQPVLNRDKSKLIFTDAETGQLFSYDLK